MSTDDGRPIDSGPRGEPHPPARERPGGVVILSSLMLVAGISEILVALDIAGGLTRAIEGLLRAPAGVPLWLPLGLGAARIACAIGLWLMRRWAWGAAVLLTGLVLTANLIAWYGGVHYELSMLVSVLIVLYLNQSSVRATFGRTGHGADRSGIDERSAGDLA